VGTARGRLTARPLAHEGTRPVAGLDQAHFPERRYGGSHGVHRDACEFGQAALCWYLGTALKVPGADLGRDPVSELPVDRRRAALALE